MTRLGAPELIILLVIIIVLFGPGRLGNVMGELGKGLRSFKDNFKEKDNDVIVEEEKKAETKNEENKE